MVITSCCDSMIRGWLVALANYCKIGPGVSSTETGLAIAVVTGDNNIDTKSSEEIIFSISILKLTLSLCQILHLYLLSV